RRAVAQELGLDPEAAWALTVSRIAPQKNLDVLVEAAGRSKRSPLEWVVVGDGDEQLRSRLAAMVEDGGARVHLLGARRDVPRLMAVADVLVVPSAWEARALVVQEAMAAGLPVVATAVGGLPGLLDGAGVLVPPGDAAALAAAVAELVADSDRAAVLGAAGRSVFARLPDEA